MLWLFVADNKIGTEGAKAIGEMLKTNKIVTCVDLSREKWFICCRDALFKLEINVLWLFVADNDIGAEGAKAIGEALKTNKTVTVVNLGGEKYFFVVRDALFKLKINVVIVCCR